MPVANDLLDGARIVKSLEQWKSVSFDHYQEVGDTLRPVRSVLAHEPGVSAVMHICPQYLQQSFSVLPETLELVAARR